MKFLIAQLFVLFSSVILLYYLISRGYFLPIDNIGNPIWLNIFFVVGLIILATQALVSLLIFLIQKKLFFGKKEFPPVASALKWGIGISLAVAIVILLNIFHLLSIQWGILIVFLVFIVIILIK